MKARGTVKGILIEGSDGAEYLLGFSRAQPAPTPILSRRTYIRELLIVSEHNIYHIGELAILRQVMGAWPPDR